MATLRDAQKQQTRRLLLDTGLALFDEKGYAATTVDDVVLAAGTTRPTFYAHFPSKAGLVDALIAEGDALLKTADEVPLRLIIERGDLPGMRAWLDRKADQWDTVGPYLRVAHQAKGSEADVAATVSSWYDRTIAEMTAGLDAAGRFDAASRHIRSVLAFGQLEFLSQRWLERGWEADRGISLATLTDSWQQLLLQE